MATKRTKKPTPSATLPKEPAKVVGKVKLLSPVDEVKDIEKQADEARDEAFQARPFFWRGKELAPFAIDREADWLQFRAAIGSPALATCMSDVTAFLVDSMRILFFCANDPSEWTGLMKDPVQLDCKIRDWARLNINGSETLNAVDTAFAIFNRAHETQAAVKPDPKSKPGK